MIPLPLGSALAFGLAAALSRLIFQNVWTRLQIAVFLIAAAVWQIFVLPRLDRPATMTNFSVTAVCIMIGAILAKWSLEGINFR